MKTRNLFIGLGIAAGALLAVTALNKKSNRTVKEFVSKNLKRNKETKVTAKDNENIYA